MTADTSLTSARDAYISAMEDERYGDARRHLLRAKGIISTLPVGGAAGASMSWTNGDITRLLRELEILQAEKDAADNGGCGFTTCDVEYSGVRG